MHSESVFKQSAFVCVLILAGCFLGRSVAAADNPLIGSWRWDNDKTLQEFTLPTAGSEQLKSDAARAKRFVEAQVNHLHSNMTLTYTEKEYTEVIVANTG